MSIDIKIYNGNPGAYTFMEDAIRLDSDKAYASFRAAKEYGIIGEKLYMLWNDCCKRNTNCTMDVLLMAPKEILEDHINYEHGRGIPFLFVRGD